jgi:uncharacterized protein (DUF488 family)
MITISSHNVEIYTIGHSNVAVDKLVQLLQKYRIEVLVDVRSVPYSRCASQFNRESLAETLRESAIEYLYDGKHLGGLPEDPRLYKSNKTTQDGEQSTSTVDYDKVAEQDWFQNAIERLIEIARERRTAIMCSEEDPERCHRYHLVGQTLLKMGVIVWHIRGKGSLERQVSLSVFQGEKQA